MDLQAKLVLYSGIRDVFVKLWLTSKVTEVGLSESKLSNVHSLASMEISVTVFVSRWLLQYHQAAKQCLAYSPLRKTERHCTCKICSIWWLPVLSHTSKIPFSTEIWQTYGNGNNPKLYTVQNVPESENKVLLRMAFPYKIEVSFEGFPLNRSWRFKYKHWIQSHL